MVQLIQASSVIGEVFSSKMLQNCTRDLDSYKYSTVGVLKELEERDLVEMIYDEEENLFYRFNHLFLKETLYQM